MVNVLWVSVGRTGTTELVAEGDVENWWRCITVSLIWRADLWQRRAIHSIWPPLSTKTTTWWSEPADPGSLWRCCSSEVSEGQSMLWTGVNSRNCTDLEGTVGSLNTGHWTRASTPCQHAGWGTVVWSYLPTGRHWQESNYFRHIRSGQICDQASMLKKRQFCNFYR